MPAGGCGRQLRAAPGCGGQVSARVHEAGREGRARARRGLSPLLSGGAEGPRGRGRGRCRRRCRRRFGRLPSAPAAAPRGFFSLPRGRGKAGSRGSPQRGAVEGGGGALRGAPEVKGGGTGVSQPGCGAACCQIRRALICCYLFCLKSKARGLCWVPAVRVLGQAAFPALWCFCSGAVSGCFFSLLLGCLLDELVCFVLGTGTHTHLAGQLLALQSCSPASPSPSGTPLRAAVSACPSIAPEDGEALPLLHRTRLCLTSAVGFRASAFLT